MELFARRARIAASTLFIVNLVGLEAVQIVYHVTVIQGTMGTALSVESAVRAPPMLF